MAGPGAVSGLEEDLTCPICLDIYVTPVSLSCGHSFCQECVRKAQRQSPQGSFSCPLCCARADPAVKLQPNVQLQSIVQRLLDVSAHQEKEEHEAPHGEKMKNSDQLDVVIPCDFCLEEPQPAVKTCLSCEASLCQAHLSKHSTKSPLRDHVLMEPCSAQFLAERRCPQHNKLLECYCETDQICLCVLCCVTSSHKDHKIFSLEEAFGQAQSVFPEALETVEGHEAALNRSISNLRKQEDEVQTKESQRRNRLESLFKEMWLQLDKEKTQVLKTLSRSEEQQLSKIQAEIQKCKQEKDATSHNVREMKALRDQKDLILFVKGFAAVRARKRNPVPNRPVVELPTPPITLDDLTVQSTLRLFRQFLSDMQSLFKSPPVHAHLTVSETPQGPRFCQRGRASSKTVYAAPSPAPNQYSSFTFQTSAFPSMVVCNPTLGSPKHSDAPPVQSEQSFSKGCHFWEVDISNAKGWKLGIVCFSFVCYLEETSNALRLFLGQTMITTKDFPASLKVVRVELDCGRNTLSFYNASLGGVNPAETLQLIETVSIPSNYPAFASFSVSTGSLQLL